MLTHQNVKPSLLRAVLFCFVGKLLSCTIPTMLDDGFVPMGDTLLVRIEDDLVFIRNHRFMTVGDVHAVVEVCRPVLQQHGSLFVMYDTSRSQGIERAARKAMTSMPPGGPTADATAVFGASFAIRTLGNMMERALVGLGQPSIGMRFFQSEADSRQYLQQERLRLKS